MLPKMFHFDKLVVQTHESTFAPHVYVAKNHKIIGIPVRARQKKLLKQASYRDCTVAERSYIFWPTDTNMFLKVVATSSGCFTMSRVVNVACFHTLTKPRLFERRDVTSPAVIECHHS